MGYNPLCWSYCLLGSKMGRYKVEFGGYSSYHKRVCDYCLVVFQLFLWNKPGYVELGESGEECIEPS